MWQPDNYPRTGLSHSHPTLSLIGCHKDGQTRGGIKVADKVALSKKATCKFRLSFSFLHAQTNKQSGHLPLTSLCRSVCEHLFLRVLTVPLLAVLAHTHSSSVPRSRVAAGALADLEADAAAGAARGPGSPGGPRSVPANRGVFTGLDTGDKMMAACGTHNLDRGRGGFYFYIYQTFKIGQDGFHECWYRA